MSKAAADIAISPGPPLPRSHPPPSLLSKLQLNVHNLLDTALGHISSSSSPSKFSSLRRSDESSQEIWSDWRKHLSRLALLSAARAHKWLGVEAGELTKDVGRAVAWLQLAEKEVSGLASPKAFTSFKSSSQKQIQGVVKVELAHIQAFLKVYKKMNDTV